MESMISMRCCNLYQLCSVITLIRTSLLSLIMSTFENVCTESLYHGNPDLVEIPNILSENWQQAEGWCAGFLRALALLSSTWISPHCPFPTPEYGASRRVSHFPL